MKILAITRLKPGATLEKIQALQVPEVTEVWRMMGEDFVREIYFDKDKPCVVLVVEAASVDAARERLSRLPMVQANLFDFDFTVLGPFIQFEHLFAR
jgi:hypothetical protein